MERDSIIRHKQLKEGEANLAQLITDDFGLASPAAAQSVCFGVYQHIVELAEDLLVELSLIGGEGHWNLDLHFGRDTADNLGLHAPHCQWFQVLCQFCHLEKTNTRV